MKLKYFLLTVFLLFNVSSTFAIETEIKEEKPSKITLEQPNKEVGKFGLKNLKAKFPKTTKFINKIKKKVADYDAILWILGALILVGATFWIAGASAWLVVLSIFGLIAYFGYLIYLVYRFIENKAELEWFWWLITGLVIAIPVSLTAIFLTASAALTLALVMVSAALMVLVVMGIVLLIIGLFKAIGSMFKFGR